MSAKFFLDTNVFVYSAAPDDPAKTRTASELIREALAFRKGVVSYQVVQEFFHVATKRFSVAMTAPEAQDYLDQVFRPLLRVHSSVQLYAEAIALQSDHRLSWYDSLIVCAARSAGCAVLYSEDLQHGQRFGSLRVVNPFV